jgi:hypothetical protein
MLWKQFTIAFNRIGQKLDKRSTYDILGGYDYLDYVGVDLQTGRAAPFSEIIGVIFSPLCHK